MGRGRQGDTCSPASPCFPKLPPLQGQDSTPGQLAWRPCESGLRGARPGLCRAAPHSPAPQKAERHRAAQVSPRGPREAEASPVLRSRQGRVPGARKQKAPRKLSSPRADGGRRPANNTRGRRGARSRERTRSAGQGARFRGPRGLRLLGQDPRLQTPLRPRVRRAASTPHPSPDRQPRAGPRRCPPARPASRSFSSLHRVYSRRAAAPPSPRPRAPEVSLPALLPAPCDAQCDVTSASARLPSARECGSRERAPRVPPRVGSAPRG